MLSNENTISTNYTGGAPRFYFKWLQKRKKNFQPKEPSEFLTRQEVADWLKVDVSTIHNWTVKGTLTKHLIEGKVLYKRAEVESSLIKS